MLIAGSLSRYPVTRNPRSGICICILVLDGDARNEILLA